ncbi:MAG: hypothetical protein JXB10_04690 [Pirellulales bacterium]|nr:hypothetical protein [Pirellulales bacterium]
MSKYFLRFLLFAILAFSTAASQAGPLCDFLRSIPRDTKRRNCWPKPFVCPDRQFTRAPFALQVDNGWQLQNMLGAHYFEEATGQLNESGRLKVRWILYEEPAQHRAVYVHVGQSHKETETRLRAVQEYAAQIMPQGDLPMITTTTLPEGGWPADRLYLIIMKNQSGQEVPHLPYLPADTDTSTSNN